MVSIHCTSIEGIRYLMICIHTLRRWVAMKYLTFEKSIHEG